MKALARHNDPDTSHDAAHSMARTLPDLEEAVLSALRMKPDGLTIDELVEEIGIQKVSLSPRLRPLCNKNLVEPGDKRKGLSGRDQTVWRAV